MTTLTGTLPALQDAFSQLSDYAAGQGITIGVADFGGYRTQADTTQILQYRQDDYNAAVRAGTIPSTMSLGAFRPIAPFGKSFHDFGAAFDVAIVARPSSLSVAEAEALLGAYAPSIGLRWGGAFSNPDPDHFELAISLADAADQFAAMGDGTAPDGDATSDSNASGVADSSVLVGVLIVGVILYAIHRKMMG